MKAKTRTAPEREPDAVGAAAGVAKEGLATDARPPFPRHPHAHDRLPDLYGGLAMRLNGPRWSNSRMARRVRAPHRPCYQGDRGNSVRMLAYNGSIPGPTLKVRQGSEILVHAINEGDLEATVHWHGLATRQRVRRDAPDAKADGRGRELHLPASLPGRGPLLVPPAHPPGLRPGDGPLRQHPRRPERARLLAAGAP